MKNYISRTGAIGALLDEYERAIDDLKSIIQNISVKKLAAVVDDQTKDEDCRSVQTILTHVVGSGYNYALVMDRLKHPGLTYRDKIPRNEPGEYLKDLDMVFQYTEKVLGQFTDMEIEETDNSKKILTRWNQWYDIEQLIEHAIVHILRHRRQIEKFMIRLEDRFQS
ncbi:MAG TPA: DinB family protein [Cyclobacteriaceae bacterium]|nr:DinB family protein [Cyclobacteriaceae bacterium]